MTTINSELTRLTHLVSTRTEIVLAWPTTENAARLASAVCQYQKLYEEVYGAEVNETLEHEENPCIPAVNVIYLSHDQGH